MKVLHIALRSLTLHSSVTHNVGANTNAGTNVGVTVADVRVSAEEVERGASTNAGTNVGATVADARVSAEEVERGFVSDGSKKTYHEKLAQFTFYLLDNKPE